MTQTAGAPKLEIRGDGQVLVYADPQAAVCIVGKDGVVATVMSTPGELVVTLEHHGKPEWQHTFTYSVPADDQTVTSYSEPQRRPRGRPRTSQALKRRLSLDDTIT